MAPLYARLLHDLTLVEGHNLTHTDPMGVEPDNPLVQTLVPFLDDLG